VTKVELTGEDSIPLSEDSGYSKEKNYYSANITIFRYDIMAVLCHISKLNV
jgi:hypothetical protein